MKQITLIAFIILMQIQLSFGQQSKNGFADFKLLPKNQYVAYFKVLSDDAFLLDEFNETLLQSGLVTSTTLVKENDKYRIKGVFNNSATADDVKIILFQFGLKMDPESLKDKNNSIPDSAKPIYVPEHALAPHYPVYVNTGKQDYDAQEFDKAKQEWIKNYPEEVNKLRGIKDESKKEVPSEK